MLIKTSYIDHPCYNDNIYCALRLHSSLNDYDMLSLQTQNNEYLNVITPFNIKLKNNIIYQNLKT